MSGGNSEIDPYYQKDSPKNKTRIKKKRRHSKETREKMRKKALERWSNPEYQKKMSEAYRRRKYTEEGLAKISAKTKKQWENPDYRKKIRKSLKEVMKDSKQREVRSRKSKKTWSDPKLREKQRKRSKAKWKEDEYRRKVTKGVRDAVKRPSWRKAHSDALKERWKDSVYRKAQLKKLRDGLKAHGLVGKKATRSKRKEREQLFDEIRQRDENTCRKCGVVSEHDKNHHVHHIIPEFIGGPELDWNLVTLCASCHRTTEAQSDWVKIPLDADGKPLLNREEIVKKWWTYYLGDPT
jgi:hypothetical protein